MAKQEIYTTGEAAKLCGVNFQTVLRWIQKRELKAYQLPGRGDNRIRKEDLIYFFGKNNIPLPEELTEPVRRVLIVEDDPATAKSLERQLARMGFDTLISTKGFSAGAMAVEYLPALITLDLQMPGIGGLEVLEMIRDREKLAQTKILVISGLPVSHLRKAIEAGANDYLEKPFQKEELTQKIRLLMGV